MKKSEKILFVQNLAEKIKEAKGITLIDYQGLNVSQINELRDKVKKAGATLNVVKNKLLQKALVKAGIKVDQEIKNPTALVLATQDEISPLKAILTTINSLDMAKFKFGWLGQKQLESEELKKLALLPSHPQLLLQLTNVLAYPIRKLAYNLNYNQQKLVIVLSEMKKKVEGGDKS